MLTARVTRGTIDVVGGGSLVKELGMNWKPTDNAFAAAAGEWTVGDQVRARTNEIKVPGGSQGTVVGFSSVGGHPLVDFRNSGLFLIRAEHLERDDDSLPSARATGRLGSPGTTRLSSTPRPRAVAVRPPPPLPDWFDRPPQPPADAGRGIEQELSDQEPGRK